MRIDASTRMSVHRKCRTLVLGGAFKLALFLAPAEAQPLLKELLPTIPEGDKLEVRLATATIPPGSIDRWHSYPTHPIVYVVKGTLTVEFRDGRSIVYEAGEGFIEPVNTVLRGSNKGQVPVELVVFRLSPPNVPDSIDAPLQ